MTSSRNSRFSRIDAGEDGSPVVVTAPTEFPFVDTFERADGALGNGWKDVNRFDPDGFYGRLSIEGGKAGSGETDNAVRGMAYREFVDSDTVFVESTMALGDVAFSQNGPVICTEVDGEFRGMTCYYNLVFGRHYLVEIGPEYNDRIVWDSNNYTPTADGDGNVTVGVARNGSQAAAYINGELVAGPCTIPELATGSNKHGMYVAASTFNAFQDITVSEDIPSFDPYTTPVIPAVPTTPIKANTSSSVNASWPASPQAGDLILGFVAGNGAGTWANADFSNKEAQFGNIAALQTAVFWKVSDGTETGTTTFTKTGGSANTCVACTMLVRNYNTDDPITIYPNLKATSDTTIPGPSYTSPNGMHCYGLWLGIATGSSNTITVPSDFLPIVHSTAGTANISMCIGALSEDDFFTPPFPGDNNGLPGGMDGSLSVNSSTNVFYIVINPAIGDQLA